MRRKIYPPKWADKILEWFCNDRQIEVLQGDLYELFRIRAENQGLLRARIHFVLDVLGLLRPFAIRRNSKLLVNMGTFRNNINIASRSLIKHRINTAINLVGLTMGISVGLMIFFHIQQELKYDRFPTRHDRIYRVTSHWLEYGPYAEAALPIASALKGDFPVIEEAVRTMKVLTNDNSGIPVRYGEKKFLEEGLLCVDPPFLQMFDIQLIHGDPKKVLDNTRSVILSEKMAKKYFGEEHPIGKVLQIEGQYNMEVTGVFEEVNDQSHMHFDMLAPIAFVAEERWGQYTFTSNWQTPFSWTYVLLNSAEEASIVSDQLDNFISRRFPEDFIRQNEGFQLKLQPLTDIHLHSDYSAEIKENSSVRMLFQLGLVGLIIFLIAAINFINLTTARSVMRAKEVGIRKTLGASKKQIVYQFLTEAFLLTLMSLILGLSLMKVLLPLFNELLGKGYELDLGMMINLIGIGLTLTVFLSLLAGLYPAILISRFQPLARSISSNGGQSNLRRLFIGLQFIASMIFIMGFIIVKRQMDFMASKGAGFDTDLTVVVNRPPQSVKNGIITEAMKGLSEVEQVSVGAGSIPGYAETSWSYHPQGTSRERYRMHTIWGTDSLISTLGVPLLRGSDFSHLHDHDSQTYVILNETAIRQLGWELDEAVGKYFGEYHWRKDTITQGRVVGVVKDFHFQSMHEPYKPLAMMYTNNDFGNLMIRLNEFNGHRTLSNLETVWNEHLPDLPFQLTFLNQKVARLYQAEKQLQQSINYFSIIAFVMSGLGLLGLASFMLMRRTKEICIRKILGATIMSILNTISREFLILTVIAFIIAVPVGYFLMDHWLSAFAFRIEMGWEPFVVAFLMLAVLCFLTVGVKSIKTAFVNPASMLREE